MRRTGRLIAVVGPSGVGKDSVMAAIAQAVPEVRVVRRIIAGAPSVVDRGEPYTATSASEFSRMVAQGGFALHWDAHGLRYGIPVSVHGALAEGRDCLANLSRGVLGQGQAVFATMQVLHITARPDTLARRMAARGRDTATQMRSRLARANTPLPDGVETCEINNDGPLHDTVAQAVARLSLAGDDTALTPRGCHDTAC
ncbi:MAG: phosphonate metabolism protein/1,5-bisphosphokinase (PRPP-forming) PhnN [Primorskyibacter sp.]